MVSQYVKLTITDQDVQIYREASDVQFDETGNRKRKYRYGDEDEIELEQTEMKRRKALNKEFKHFADKIAEQVRICCFNDHWNPPLAKAVIVFVVLE